MAQTWGGKCPLNIRRKIPRRYQTFRWRACTRRWTWRRRQRPIGGSCNGRSCRSFVFSFFDLTGREALLFLREFWDFMCSACFKKGKRPRVPWKKSVFFFSHGHGPPSFCSSMPRVSIPTDPYISEHLSRAIMGTGAAMRSVQCPYDPRYARPSGIGGPGMQLLHDSCNGPHGLVFCWSPEEEAR